MTKSEIQNKISEVNKYFEINTHCSPYCLAKLVGFTNTQMAYNYVKVGIIKTTNSTTGKKQISKAEAIRFANAYLSKKA